VAEGPETSSDRYIKKAYRYKVKYRGAGCGYDITDCDNDNKVVATVKTRPEARRLTLNYRHDFFPIGSSRPPSVES